MGYIIKSGAEKGQVVWGKAKKISNKYIDVVEVAVWCPNSWNMEGGSERKRHEPDLLVEFYRQKTYIEGGAETKMFCNKCLDLFTVDVPHHLGRKDPKIDGR